MARPIKRLKAEPEVVEELRRRSRARTSMVRDRQRAEIILLRLEGVSVAEIASHCHRGHPAAEGLHTLERAQHGPPRWRLA